MDPSGIGSTEINISILIKNQETQSLIYICKRINGLLLSKEYFIIYIYKIERHLKMITVQETQ